ncbi:farnesyl-diphosphate farnesyltransferase [Elusimicrobium posterum]|uniref:phytoene/squalene synthase family protein n=1 Tax=Elusimicrobium posterum TaxID=3116653 RepID=UPI003C738AFF
MKTTLELLIDKTSRTLSFSARILGPKIRHTFMTGYILCRYADTIADTSSLSHERKIYWIKQFPQIIETQKGEDIFALEQEFAQGEGLSEGEKLLIKNLPLCLTEFNILTSDNKELVMGIVRKVCEGMLFDLQTFNDSTPKAVSNEEELKNYCACMGGAPGIFWSRLILKETTVGMEEEKFINYGQSIGNALQIVNILRDQAADIKNNRTYLPAPELAAQGLGAKDLAEADNFERLKPVINKWIDWGVNNLSCAASYYTAIPKKNWKTRASVAWPVLWTYDTFTLLKNAENLLEGAKKVKIKKRNIYFTIILTPLYLISNRLFTKALKKRLAKING